MPYSEPSLTPPSGGPIKERYMRDNNTCGVVYKIQFVQRPQNLNNESGKTIHTGTIDRGLAVFSIQNSITEMNTIIFCNIYILTFNNIVVLEVLTAMTMKNAVFLDIKTQFAPRRKNITYYL
jgi:hypothetical protein